MARRHLLVVSRDADLVTWASAAAADLGWDVTTARGLTEAFVLIEAADIDAVLVSTKGTSILEVAQDCARLHERAPSVPIAVLTSEGSPHDVLSFRIAGARAVFDRASLSAEGLGRVLERRPPLGSRKPVRPGEVRRHVDRAIENRTPPPALLALARSMDHGIASRSEIVARLREDARLADRALRLSACLLPPHIVPLVDSVEVAAMRLEPSEFRALVLGFLVFEDVVFPGPLLELLRFRDHAVGCGLAARKLAPLAGGVDPGDALITGLLHDMGISLLVEAVPSLYEDVVSIAGAGLVDLVEAERQVLGIGHDEVTVRAFTTWGLPAPVRSAVARMDASGAGAEGDLPRLLRAAHALCWELDLSLRLRSAVPPRGPDVILGLPNERIWERSQGLRSEVRHVVRTMLRARESATSR